MQPLHRSFITDAAGLLIDGLVVLKECGDCVDPVALSLRRRGRRARRLHGRPPLTQQILGERSRERVRTLADRDAPVRHGAGRLALGNRAEGSLGLGIEERVQQRHTAVELLPRVEAAGDLEMNAAESLPGPMTAVLGLRIHTAGEGEQRAREDQSRHGLEVAIEHRVPLLPADVSHAHSGRS